MTSTELQDFVATFKKQASLRGLSAGSDWVAWFDDTMFVYAVVSIRAPSKTNPGFSLLWRILVKPFDGDELLWKLLFPDSDMGGARKKLNLRATGAFRLDGLPLSQGFLAIDPLLFKAQVDGFLDEFDEAAAVWKKGSDRLAQFIGSADALILTAPEHKISRWNLHRTIALLLLGRYGDAREAVRSELDNKRDGALFSGGKSINRLILEHLEESQEGTT